MNGVHDLGGMDGMGAVTIEPDEPVFHERWEARMCALNLACSGLGRWNLDTGRHARERLAPAVYLGSSYYELWLHGLEKLLLEHGLVSERELTTGRAEGRDPTVRAVPAAAVAPALKKGGSARRAQGAPARFRPGDAVVARNIHPSGHTRLPRYARGRRGIVAIDHGVFVFADSHAMTGEERPQHCYSVRFSARELWGAEAPARDAVYIDLWDEHLDGA